MCNNRYQLPNHEREDGYRVLVDRIWPRGASKANAAVDEWAKDLAPSTGLRKWFDHDTAKWEGFRQKYCVELERKSAELRGLLETAGGRTVTLVFSAKDAEHNQAVVLKDVLERMSLDGTVHRAG